MNEKEKKQFIKEYPLNNLELENNNFSLYNFLKFYDIDYINNYNLINYEYDYWEYEFIQNYENKIIIEFFENNGSFIYNLNDLSNYDLNQMLKNHYNEFLYYIGKEYFQYLIIKENDLFLIKKYLNYDILYNSKLDIYLLCIDHLGIGYDYVLSNKELLNYLLE